MRVIFRQLVLTCIGLFLCIGTLSSPAYAQMLDEIPDSITHVTVEQYLLDTISAALPEETGAIDQNFLNMDYNPNVYLEMDSQIAITFIDEGAGYRNALGYFSYDNDSFSSLSFGDIDTDNSGRVSTSELNSLYGVSLGMLFPNASKSGSGGLLNTGDTYVIGDGDFSLTEDSWDISGGTTFEAGTNLGFFVVANGWNDYGSVGTVDGWDGTSGDPNTYYSIDFLNPENSADATIDTASYSSRHTALTFESDNRDTLIMGFEDLHRLQGSDDDFNDAVFLVRASPNGAIANTNVAVYSAPAPIVGGGIWGVILCLILFWRRKAECKNEKNYQ